MSSILDTVTKLVPGPLTSASDTLVALVHAVFVQKGYTLQKSSTETDKENVLPKDWNSNQELYTVGYTKGGKSLHMKVVRMGGNMVILVDEDSKAKTLTIPLSSLSQSQYPLELDNVSNLPADLVSDLAHQINEAFLPTSPTPTQDPQHAARQDAPVNKLKEDQSHPFDLSRHSHSHSPSPSPYSIGASDLDPIPSHPTFGHSGMVMTPSHPLFTSPHHPHGGGIGPFAGPGPETLPPGAVPPGARFDPITPLGPQPGLGGGPRGAWRGGSGRGGSGRGSGPFGGGFRSGEPDNDELPPPGYNDMFM
ncbi:Proteasome inhibitor PI31 subunit [Gaertneriomyces sp. JEL0708]|nr:Proteasome inhibitor PI31 subunit [Gaertneriomyces sp. JEL0708]